MTSLSRRQALRASAIAALSVALWTANRPARAAAGRRIVSVGGAVTEILFALGKADEIVAVDTTSTFPAAAGALPNVGYMRALAAEGVLSVAPDLILAQEGAGPPDALAILAAGSVPLVTIPDVPSPAGVADKIRAVGAAVGANAAADELAESTAARFAALRREVAAVTVRKRVLFVLSLAGGRATVGGTGTAADALIALAGGVNAAEAIAGYKPMSDEAILAAAPDLVISMARGDHALDAATVFALPAFAGTPAAADRSLLAMDGLYLLGFGPRTPDAARDVAAALYPGSIAPADPAP
ncbi:heme/hemin ABC transporter substrate-binding protein [Methylobrevis albus]|uniref:ABC transporter substrate-binding protein n=1 Tax=Methylobrevis albus TaxID=2793297 RepID=A0A931I124_9HYPH|nr:ABC transporter substrate-binding protein [Methylobrevis albus]MBH0237807.1 ABC transporter substrate-binding protein [Methylobrevis albus]